ncbi:FAD:protein FMN transferase [Arthrobacter oryzae]|uniref:FAD:protein FMN transferase n=1 Tax=Arthrobacter oryzae TaxID=409290 RepID=UPI001FC9CF14|nr:FAD:protein FMN transferase [Arthrobacter oryzae]
MVAHAGWTVWGLEASLTVTDVGMLAAARGIVNGVLADVDFACSRFTDDSELARLQPRLAAGALVSPTLRDLVERALDAARWTDGDVDPTLGADLAALGYDRDIVSVRVLQDHSRPPVSPPSARQERRVPGWSRISIDGRTLTVPEDIRLDLGATAKAVAADRAAAQVHAQLGCGVLVALGGDLATAGPGPATPVAAGAGAAGHVAAGPWQILVQDLPTDPSQRVALDPGFAMATSSTQKRRWKQAGADVHHILDPRFGRPAETVWRTVTVAAPTCLEANAFSTAGIVRGFAAVDWFRAKGVTARLVDQRGRIVRTGGWPAENHNTEARASRG